MGNMSQEAGFESLKTHTISRSHLFLLIAQNVSSQLPAPAVCPPLTVMLPKPFWTLELKSALSSSFHETPWSLFRHSKGRSSNTISLGQAEHKENREHPVNCEFQINKEERLSIKTVLLKRSPAVCLMFNTNFMPCILSLL